MLSSYQDNTILCQENVIVEIIANAIITGLAVKGPGLNSWLNSKHLLPSSHYLFLQQSGWQ